MNIEKFIKKVCKQTAVYWGTPVKDGYGNYTFADPVEIKCRWEDKITIITGQNGEQEICSASVLVYQDLDAHGWIMLGRLTDIPAGVLDTPKAVDGAHEILYFSKIPLIFSTTKFVRNLLLK